MTSILPNRIDLASNHANEWTICCKTELQAEQPPMNSIENDVYHLELVLNCGEKQS